MAKMVGNYKKQIRAMLTLLLVCLYGWFGWNVGIKAHHRENGKWTNVTPNNTDIVSVKIFQNATYNNNFAVLAITKSRSLLFTFIEYSVENLDTPKWIDISNSKKWDGFPLITVSETPYIVDHNMFYLIDTNGQWHETGHSLPNAPRWVRFLDRVCCQFWLIADEDSVKIIAPDFERQETIFAGKGIKQITATQQGLIVEDRNGKLDVPISGITSTIILDDVSTSSMVAQIYPEDNRDYDLSKMEITPPGKVIKVQTASIGHWEQPTRYILAVVEGKGIWWRKIPGGLGAGIGNYFSEKLWAIGGSVMSIFCGTVLANLLFLCFRYWQKSAQPPAEG